MKKEHGYFGVGLAATLPQLRRHALPGAAGGPGGDGCGKRSPMTQVGARPRDAVNAVRGA